MIDIFFFSIFLSFQSITIPPTVVLVEVHGRRVDLGSEEGEEEVEMVDGERVGDDVPALG